MNQARHTHTKLLVFAMYMLPCLTVFSCSDTESRPPTAHRTIGPAPEAQHSEPGTYRDPDGYFLIGFPRGWRIADEYPGDPRGKVLLSSGDGSVSIRVVTQAKPGDTIEDLLANAGMAKERLPSLRYSQARVNGRDCVVMENSGSAPMYMVGFVEQGVNHSISYIAEKGAAFREHRMEADLIIASYVPLPKNATDAEVRVQQAAQRLRLAELYSQMGDDAAAKVCLREALELDPENDRIQERAREMGLEPVEGP